LKIFAWYYGKKFKSQNYEQYLAYKNKTNLVLYQMIICFIIYMVWVTGLKHLLHLPRPFLRLPEGSVFILDYIKIGENPNASFPSGHSAFSMMMLVSIWSLLNKYLKVIGVFLVIWIGISRIVLGVHFPSDVVGSWILSFFITYLACKVFRLNYC
ncbi:MAG: phosphatase PAP2 family protein, partial [Pseudomonadota bacterium]